MLCQAPLAESPCSMIVPDLLKMVLRNSSMEDPLWLSCTEGLASKLRRSGGGRRQQHVTPNFPNSFFTVVHASFNIVRPSDMPALTVSRTVTSRKNTFSRSTSMAAVFRPALLAIPDSSTKYMHVSVVATTVNLLKTCSSKHRWFKPRCSGCPLTSSS